MSQDPEPLLLPWIVNPPRRVWWWTILIGLSCLQVIWALRGRWTTRHSLSMLVMVGAIVVAHPVMNRRLPLFRADILQSWRTYVGIALVAISNLIEVGTLF